MSLEIDLRDRVVLVTGASTGIGRAIALGAARAGADVVANYYHDEAGAQEVAAEIHKLGRECLLVHANVASVSQIHHMYDQLRRRFGRIDVLINNAAVTVWTDLFETTEEQWDQCLDVNLKGTFFCAIEAARLMREQGEGSIVNTSTNCAALGVKDLSVYAASKGGVHALTRQLAVELAAYKIRVNTVAPGPTQVERNLRSNPEYDANWGAVVPLRRTALPEELVGPTLFLASDLASFVTGQLLYADGGWSVAGKTPRKM